jgi:hypothetical protein
VDGLAISSLLAPNTFPPSFPPTNDNLLIYPGTPHLTLGGVSFQLSDGADINLFFGGFTGNPTGYQLIGGPHNEAAELLTTFTTSPTPEPESLMLLGTGALGLIGVVRRRFA